MIILSKRRYQFKNGDERVITQGNGVIETVPDWVAKTDLYQDAEAEGNIMEVKTSEKTVTSRARKAPK